MHPQHNVHFIVSQEAYRVASRITRKDPDRATAPKEPDNAIPSAFSYEQFLEISPPDRFKESFSGIRTVANNDEKIADSPAALMAYSIYAYLYAKERNSDLRVNPASAFKIAHRRRPSSLPAKRSNKHSFAVWKGLPATSDTLWISST